MLLADFWTLFLSPFLTVLLAEVTRQSWSLLDNFLCIFRRGMSRNTWFDCGCIFFVSLWMALEEFLIFLRGLLDSDPEVVASFSLCGHARRQQRQWHAFSWFCLSSCTSAVFPTIAGRCSCGVMAQIMDNVMVSCDVELIVAECHRSWRNRDGNTFRDVVPQVLLRFMVVPVVIQRTVCRDTGCASDSVHSP